MCTGDTRIVSEHVGFCSYEDLGTSSANLTKYLFKEVQLEPTVVATHLNSELPLFLLSISRLLRQRDIYFCFSPAEIAKLLFSSLKKIRINSSHSQSAINNYVIWKADTQDIPTLVNSKCNQWAKLSAAYTSIC